MFLNLRRAFLSSWLYHSRMDPSFTPENNVDYRILYNPAGGRIRRAEIYACARVRVHEW